MSDFDWDIVLLTQKEYIAPKAPDVYVQNIILEDQLIQNELENQGWRVHRTSWDDPHINWKRTRFALFRATWDYFHRFPEFSSWLNQVQSETTLLNSADLIKWNMDKHYLLDLIESKVPVVPTQILEPKSNLPLSEFYDRSGFQEAILKPAISGAARHTYRLRRDNIAEHENVFKQLMENEAMMLQPFQERILTEGEVSLIYFGTNYSHAIRKKAKPGDFRVQDDFGGSLHEHEPDQQELIVAQAALEACPELPIYARVDLVRNDKNEPQIMELELIEPELWFRRNNQAAKLLASVLNTHLTP